MYTADVLRMIRSLLLMAASTALAAAVLPEVHAYTTALVRTGSGGMIKVVAAQPSGGTQPYVYCTAPDRTVVAGFSTTIPVTCTNGFAHSVSLTVGYSSGPSTLVPPSYSPAIPLSLTVPANSQASTSISVSTGLLTSKATYTLSYAGATSGSPAVTISGIDFQSTLEVS